MFLRLFLLFVFVPLIDLVFLIAMAKYLSFWFTVFLIICSAIFGAYYAKRSGIAVMRQFREQLGAGKMPTESLADGAIVLFAGGLLLTPGLITDIFGMTMLFPYTRRFYKRLLSNWAKKRFKFTAFPGGMHSNDPNTVDAQVVDRDPPKPDGTDENPRKVDPAKIELQVDDPN